MWNIMPNNSTTLNRIVLQRLTMKIAVELGVPIENYKQNHSGGAIGKILRVKNRRMMGRKSMSVENEEIASVCTGCGCCMNICPAEAVKMKYDETGYLKPVVDRAQCTECGKCVHSCPQAHGIDAVNNFKEPICYAVWSNDDIRMCSSSGGFFTALARYVFDRDGYVYGAAWNEDFFCEIVEASNEKELVSMRHSKYVQSDTKYTFRKVEKHLKRHEKVVYVGCPCQIAGLNAYLDSEGLYTERGDLITVDLVCFYAPSNIYFRKYLDEQYGVGNVADVKFRDKSSRGWSPVSYRIELKNGSAVCPDPADDPYQMAFHSALARRELCDNCEYYQFPRQGDFTMGDFWGIEKHDPTWTDGKGTSVVLVNNTRAAGIFEDLKSQFARWQQVPLAWCMNKGNRIGTEARPGHIRKGYFEFLIKDRSFRESVERALNGKYEIGCVCMFNENIGNNLTNYALYRTLSDRGYSVLMIGNPGPEECAAIEYREERFKRFSEKPYPDWTVFPSVSCKEEYYDLNDKCDMFLVASDQLWRKRFLDWMDSYTTLDWAQSGKYKVSYATSFGTDEFEGDERDRQRLGYFLKRFQYLSVREKSGSNLVLELADRKADVVSDPVFLLKRAVYESMADTKKDKLPEGRYVAAYFLDKSRKKEDALFHLCNSMADGVYRAMTDTPEEAFEGVIDYIKEPSVEEWLAVIRGCDFFLTDSFHGICFALIFEKQFAVIFDKENWRGYTRIHELLEKVGLKDRYVDGDTDALSDLLSRPIPYKRVNEFLDREREFSCHWLLTALEKGKGYFGGYDIYDEIINKEAKSVKRERELRIWQDRLLKMVQQLGSRQFLERHMAWKAYGHVDSRKKGEKMTVVGFGAGKCFHDNIGKIRQVYDLRIVCDNDPIKWGCEAENGITCISPLKLKEIEGAFVVIMVEDTGTAFEIAEQLIDMGILRFTHISNWLKAINVDNDIGGEPI